MPVRQPAADISSEIQPTIPTPAPTRLAAIPPAAAPSTATAPRFPAIPPIEEPAPELREWTSGQFTTRAEFVALHDGVVTLRKQSGGNANLPLNRLSPRDRHYIKQLIKVDRAANIIVGKVTAVIDGDTIAVTDEDGNEFKIRLKGTDAPEIGQVFGDKAKEALEKMLNGRSPWIEWDQTSSDGLFRGSVYLDGEFINLKMVGDGLAWHVPVEEPNFRFENAVLVAKANRRGLWSVPNPVPPWTYREVEKRARR